MPTTDRTARFTGNENMMASQNSLRDLGTILFRNLSTDPRCVRVRNFRTQLQSAVQSITPAFEHAGCVSTLRVRFA